MDLVHHLYRLIAGGQLFFAPISDNPQRVLDLGTGTGIWAMDFAETPPNCSFEVDDYEDEWLYRRPFDFIHGRELEGCIANDDKLLERAFQHLAPGGYIELQATSARFTSEDGTHEKATNTTIWLDALFEGAAKFGKPLDIAPKWKNKVEATGFVDVQERILKLPVGTWPKDAKLKEVGSLQYYQQLQAVDSYTPGMIARVLGWSDPEVQVLMAKVKSELKDPTIHLYLPVHFVWGRKPE
ncbi:putative umta methyltransferase family protein [Phaeoacremonium minimum UCRPA7]|uniref:Putative umta methyltransferase family protein n=1 Tax=Phaeoacremonium minimum (strain UCR-PA7) TaxID=1286976 RepID=R8BNB2_PHAM7|nr:putative umta methyltransferase family protein [Phaeoacremonium minimum UCRPA7]EOO00873.1 putative umta methyltransferase family protein [Phaeoacremonium minimum UCRPA7]